MSFVYHNTTAPITASATVSVSANTILNNGVSLTVPGNILQTTSTNASYITVTGSNGMSYDDLKPNTLHVKGRAEFENDMEVKGKITANGVDLGEALQKIEERLNILRPNHRLEAEWDKLRELGEQYRQLERDMLEKLEMVEILKRKY
jgi:hypothetical protein